VTLPLVKTTTPMDLGLEHSFAQGIRLLLQTVQGLPVSGWEVSCRIAPGSVSTERLLLGFDTHGVSASRLASLAPELGMPDGMAAEFQEDLESTARILLAVECAFNGLEIRAYQAFKNSTHGMRGFKWLAQDPGKCRITEYAFAAMTWRSLLDFYEMQQRPYRQVGVGIADPVKHVAGRIAQRAMKAQSPSQAVEFFSVSERAGARASSCFRLYETGLSYSDVSAEVASLLSFYQLNSALPRLEALMAERPLGWIAVGEDSLGIPFLTLYGEASVLDARRLMVFGAGK
jgi:hypothetical protein